MEVGMGKTIDSTTDEKKRAFLKALTQLVGCAGAAGVVTPLLTYWQPSKDTQARGEPVEIDIRGVAMGAQKTILWRQKPVWVIRRSERMIASLYQQSVLLSDPDSLSSEQPSYTKNTVRSVRPDILVLLGVCTHLGCSPTYRPEPGAIDAQWPGGFYCSCHGSKFDLAGRVYKNMPAPTNLMIPPHYYKDAQTLVIGASEPGA